MSLTKNSSAFWFLVIINELERDLGGNRDFIRNFIWAAPPPTIVPRGSPKQNWLIASISIHIYVYKIFSICYNYVYGDNHEYR